MVTQSPQELISLWELILTGAYDASATASSAAPQTTEVFEETLTEEVQAQETGTSATSETTSETASSEGASGTRSEILSAGRALMDAALILWQSLDQDVQEQMRLQAQNTAQQAALRAKAYWNALTPEAQQSAREKAEQAADKAVSYWQSLPA